MKKFLGRSAGRTAEGGPKADPAHLFRHRKLLAGLRKLGRERPALAASVGRLIGSTLSSPPLDLAEASAREERVHGALLRALAFQSRLEVLRRAAELAAGSGAISPRARQPGPWRTPIPGEAERRFRRMPNADSGACRTPVPGEAEDRLQ